jgi:MFS family permease
MRWGTATVAPAKARLPRRFWAWITGSTTSLLGTQMLFFALAWVAAGHGGAAAGLVLTAGNLPRTALLLVGGALADRVGLWRVLVVGDVVMTVATGLLALAVVTLGTPLWLLIGAAFLTGVVDASTSRRRPHCLVSSCP